MDVREITDLFPGADAWMKRLSRGIFAGGLVNDKIKQCVQEIAGEVLDRALARSEELGVSLEIYFRNVLLLAIKHRPYLLGPIYLTCLSGARHQCAPLMELRPAIEEHLKKNGWWDLFARGVKDQCVFDPRNSLTPLLNLQIRLATRGQRRVPIRAAQVLDDLELIEGVRRNTQAKCLTEFLKNYPVGKFEGKDRFHNLSLTAQVLLVENPNQYKQLFGRLPNEHGINTRIILQRWRRAREIEIHVPTLEAAIRSRDWERGRPFFELVNKTEFFSAQSFKNIREAIEYPALPDPRFPRQWGMPGVVAKALHKMAPSGSGQAELIELLRTPIKSIFTRALRDKSYLMPRPSWLPDSDWHWLQSSFSTDQAIRLARSGRSDLLHEIPESVIFRNQRWAVRQYGDTQIQSVVLKNINNPSIVDAVSSDYNLDHGNQKSLGLIKAIYDASDLSTECSVRLIRRINAQGHLAPLLDGFTGPPRRFKTFASGVGSLHSQAAKKLWFSWLIEYGKANTEVRDYLFGEIGAWLDGIPSNQVTLLKAEGKGNGSLLQLIPAGLRNKIWVALAKGNLRKEGKRLTVTEDVPIACLQKADFHETLHILKAFPALGPRVSAHIATLFPVMKGPELLIAFHQFPCLTKAWGSNWSRKWRPRGTDRETRILCAIKAAHHPRASWRLLLDEETACDPAALKEVKSLLDPQPSRKATLELASVIGFRHLSALTAVALESRRSQQETGSKLDHLYHSCEIPKKSGGMRTLTIPPPWIKRLQRLVNDHILHDLGVDPHAHGFVRGRSILTNASNHVGKELVIGCDLKSAFPSTHWGLILRTLRRDLASTLSAPSIRLLLDLCTHSGGLPVGAPSSPALLNRVLFQADVILSEEAERRCVTYSRYADDLCFSGDDRALEMLPIARRVVASAGFRLDPKKTNIHRRGRRQMVTGLVVNDIASTPRRLRRQLRAAVHHLENGETPYWRGGQMELQALIGRLAFVKMANPREGERLILRVKEALRSAP